MIGEGRGNQKAKSKIGAEQNRKENIFHFPYYICHRPGTIFSNDERQM